MNRTNTTASALRLSALMVAAGAVVGLAGQVVAQSAPVRLERTERAAAEACEQAQQIVREMRRELSREDDQEGEKRVRVRVHTDGDQHAQTLVQPRTRVQVEPGEMKRRVEVERRAAQGNEQARKRTAVRRIEGGAAGGKQPEVCPECGQVKGDGGEERVIKLRRSGGMEGLKGLQGMKIEGLEGLESLKGMKIEGLEGLEALKGMKIEGLEGLKELHGMKLDGGEGEVFWLGREGDKQELHEHLMELHGQGGDMHKLHEHLMQLHGLGGKAGEGNVQGKAIVIGPDGQKQEFNFGGGESGKAKVKKQKVEQKQKIEKGQKGGQSGTLFKAIPGEGFSTFVVPGHGGDGAGHGAGHGVGKVIIITPDGQRREFNFDENGPHGEGRFEMDEMHDGSGHTAHPFGGGALVAPAKADGQRVKVRWVSRNAV